MKIALAMKFLRPLMLQVTTVAPPSGRKVNSPVFVAAKGSMNSSFIRMISGARLSVMVIRPLPTSLLPSQL